MCPHSNSNPFTNVTFWNLEERFLAHSLCSADRIERRDVDQDANVWKYFSSCCVACGELLLMLMWAQSSFSPAIVS